MSTVSEKVSTGWFKKMDDRILCNTCFRNQLPGIDLASPKVTINMEENYASQKVIHQPVIPQKPSFEPVQSSSSFEPLGFEKSPEKKETPVPKKTPPKKNQECQSCLSFSLHLQEYEGFQLCEACLSSDKKTALEIARSRHADYLKHLKNGLA